MSKSIQDIPKSRGRPKTTGRGEGVLVRVQPTTLQRLDTFRDGQPEPKPSRPEALRQLAEEALDARGIAKPGPHDEGMRPDELNASNDD